MRTKASLVLACALLALGSTARAQTGDVDSDSDPVRVGAEALTPSRADAHDASQDVPDAGVAAVPTPPPVPVKKVEGRDKLKPILTPTIGDAELIAIWTRWRTATSDLRLHDAEAAQKELLEAKADLGINDLEPFAIGFLREARLKRREKDMLASINLAATAVELAPDLPYTHLGLAEAYFAADLSSPGRYFTELRRSFVLALRDPRYARALGADAATTILLALLGTAIFGVLVLFLRRLRYILHDFHHLFPRAAQRWQTGAVAFLLLALPLVFRMGAVAELLALFFASCFYLSLKERIVAAVLIALVGVVPLGAGAIARHTAFAGTVAEDVFQLERGGLSAAEAAERVKARIADNDAGFEELFALGRYEARRGKLADAVAHYKLAATHRNNDARLLTDLGNAVLIQGDMDGASELYTNATNADATLADAFYDLAKLHYRKATIEPDETVGQELDRAQTALTTAQHLDPRLLGREDPPPDHLMGNRLLLSPGLSIGEIVQLAQDGEHGASITTQLANRIVGEINAWLGAIYPGLLALLLIGIGALRSRGKGASKPCHRCGRAVCRRCDPELGVGSTLCNQCVHVFARRGAVPSSEKVRKQIEIRRFEERRNRIAYAFGAVGAGLGHLFSGLPIRGAIYLFVFLFGLFNLVLRNGVLRPPYGPAPLWLTVVPAALVLALAYLLSLRGLFLRQNE